MRTLWTKIGLGALGVFLVGMLLLTVVEDARSTVEGAISHIRRAHDAHEAQADIPFMLAGRRLGTVNHMAIRRAASHDLARFTLTVSLDAGVDRSALEACKLVPVDDNDLDIERGFRCAGDSESDWSEIGSVVFESTGLELPILAGSDVAAKLHRGESFSADADLSGPFRLSATGDHGELVHLKADSNGALLRVNGKNGQALVRLKADKSGFYLSVDSSAAH